MTQSKRTWYVLSIYREQVPNNQVMGRFAGNLVVDGVAVSVYTIDVGGEGRMHTLTAPLRALWRTAPSVLKIAHRLRVVQSICLPVGRFFIKVISLYLPPPAPIPASDESACKLLYVQMLNMLLDSRHNGKLLWGCNKCLAIIFLSSSSLIATERLLASSTDGLNNLSCDEYSTPVRHLTRSLFPD